VQANESNHLIKAVRHRVTLYAHNRESIFDFEVSPAHVSSFYPFSLRALLDERGEKEPVLEWAAFYRNNDHFIVHRAIERFPFF